MKITIPCPVCAKPGIDVYSIVSNLQVQNDGFYRFLCMNGHKVVCVIQDEKFEILFELAINAIYDGYYREAITCFSSSIEAYRKYFIQVILQGHGVEGAELGKAWKEVENLSERQLGAYFFIHTYALKRAPSITSKKLVELRNKVIHKGFIPEKEQALAFGEEVRLLMWEGIESIKKDFSLAAKSVLNNKLYPEIENTSEDHRVCVMSGISKLLSLTHVRTDETIEQYIERLKIDRFKKGI